MGQGNRDPGSGQQAANSPYGWCCIIFVQQKMSAIALHAILQMTPALKFLRSAPFMGFGGTTSATSLNAKVSQPSDPFTPSSTGSCPHTVSLEHSQFTLLTTHDGQAMLVGVLKGCHVQKTRVVQYAACGLMCDALLREASRQQQQNLQTRLGAGLLSLNTLAVDAGAVLHWND